MRIHICVWWKQVHTQQNWEKIFVKWGSQHDTLQWPSISKCDMDVKNTNLKAITWVSYYSSFSVTYWWLISKLMVNVFLIFEFLSNFKWISISFSYYKGCVWGIIFIFILVSHASIEFSTSDCGLFQMNQSFWFSQDLLQWFYFVWNVFIW